MEVLPRFFSLFPGSEFSEGSACQELRCSVYSFGFFEKAQYPDERNPKTFLREEALHLWYLELKHILGLCVSLGE